jgi:4-hydroxythreonine-4-phosphate dehydrogenase
MSEGKKIRVGISVGDINGVGPEIILKTFQDNRMLDFCTPVVFTSTKTISHQRKELNIQANYNGVDNVAKAVDGKLNIVNVWKEAPKVEFGKATKEGGIYAIKSLKAATKALKEGEVDVLLTAPINKKNVQSDEFTFPGHTNYLAKELEGESLMLMVSGGLRVGLLTDHIPVKDVAKAITPTLIEKKVNIVLESLKKDFKIRKPKIALLGINPHSGDNGTIGKEDDEVLKPTIEKIAEKGVLVYGPYSADSFFASDSYLKFDAILAAYHDQGLIPFKTLAFGKGVNYTAGLSKIRTSPDHGTAYEIAGQGKADESSFKEALFMAIELYRNRKEHKELSQKPLRKLA